MFKGQANDKRPTMETEKGQVGGKPGKRCFHWIQRFDVTGDLDRDSSSGGLHRVAVD